MSIHDTIAKLISDSEGAARELTWFLRALPNACATEVMGSRDMSAPAQVIERSARRQFAEQLAYADAGIQQVVMPQLTPAFVPDTVRTLVQYATNVTDLFRHETIDAFIAHDPTRSDEAI